MIFVFYSQVFLFLIRFKEHVNQNQPKELVTHEEMLEMCKTVPKNELMANDVTTLPGDEIGSTDEDSSSSDDVKVPSVLPESVATKFKSLIVEKRQEAFVSLKEEIEKISPFEDAVSMIISFLWMRKYHPSKML